MRIKRKPDLLFILAVLVGIGVLVTMRIQGVPAAAPSGTAAEALPSVSVATSVAK
jgi:hypothetical protein